MDSSEMLLTGFMILISILGLTLFFAMILLRRKRKKNNTNKDA